MQLKLYVSGFSVMMLHDSIMQNICGCYESSHAYDIFFTLTVNKALQSKSVQLLHIHVMHDLNLKVDASFFVIIYIGWCRVMGKTEREMLSHILDYTVIMSYVTSLSERSVRSSP